MSFEVNTLFLLTIDVEAILGLLLLLVWVQSTRVHAVAWWASAHLLRAVSVMLYGLYGSVPDLLSIDLPNVLLFSSFGVTWNGARVFNGRDALPGSLIAGAGVWLLASQWPGFEAGSEVRGQLSALIIATYTWLTAYEFWRARREPLVSRWPAIVLFFTDGAMFLLRTPLNALLHGKDADTILSSAWLSVLSLEAFLMTIATAFILLAMSKERTELRHKTAAMTDPLTGLLNRRAFLQDAETLLQQQVARDRPIAVLLIDLDHFKSINDRFGHAVGDKVLQIFAKTTRAGLRQADLVGRLGGEEFTVVLADAGMDNAYLVADRLRRAFAAAAAMVDGEMIHATASIGVSVIVDPRQDLAKLITLADQALYLAKARGRNRVEVAPIEVADEIAELPAIVRVERSAA
ncbi:MAG: GGDEF domain-containing protein [Alphaproteobacteria bacterium]|nr:MAG: GGDEF domain-containing protein [Alphaproteobacteria bacterium]